MIFGYRDILRDFGGFLGPVRTSLDAFSEYLQKSELCWGFSGFMIRE